MVSFLIEGSGENLHKEGHNSLILIKMQMNE